VVWADFKIPKGLACYRTGIQFANADQALRAPFIQTNTTKK
jgi:hypothetical protein